MSFFDYLSSCILRKKELDNCYKFENYNIRNLQFRYIKYFLETFLDVVNIYTLLINFQLFMYNFEI